MMPMTDTSPAAITEPTDRDIALDMGARLIAQCEGFRPSPYADSGGTWTIGYGTTRIDSNPVTAETPSITIDQALALMMGELGPTAEQVDGMIHIAVSVGQRAALYSFAYNVGASALEHSALIRMLNADDFAGAAGQFAEWVYAGGKRVQGLANRRALERAVFVGDVVP